MSAPNDNLNVRSSQHPTHTAQERGELLELCEAAKADAIDGIEGIERVWYHARNMNALRFDETDPR